MTEPRVAVFMGGLSDEHDVSLSSGKKVLSTLQAKNPTSVVIERDGSGFLDFGAEGRQHFPALPEPEQRPSNPYGEHEDWHLEEWDEDFALDGEGMFALAAGRYRSRRNPKRK